MMFSFRHLRHLRNLRLSSFGIRVHRCPSVVVLFRSGNLRYLRNLWILFRVTSVVCSVRTLVTWCLCGENPAGSRSPGSPEFRVQKPDFRMRGTQAGHPQITPITQTGFPEVKPRRHERHETAGCPGSESAASAESADDSLDRTRPLHRRRGDNACHLRPLRRVCSDLGDLVSLW